MLLSLILALGQAVSLPQGAVLTEEIRAADAVFFRIYFEACDPAKITAMVTPDVEMYHDKAGFIFTSAEAFVADYAKGCEAKKAPDAWRSRRELVPSTLRVDPIPGFGAIEEGDHYFYERKGDGPEKRVGKAHFVQVWQRTPEGWKLKRILSYAHESVE